jgi:hypothetical protein
MIEEEDKTTVYIAGPMRGVLDFNRKEFDRAEANLIRKGIYNTISPVSLDKLSGLTDEELSSPKGLRQVMKRDLNELCECDAIYMLNNWERSEGATIEHRLAAMLGLFIIYQ